MNISIVISSYWQKIMLNCLVCCAGSSPQELCPQAAQQVWRSASFEIPRLLASSHLKRTSGKGDLKVMFFSTRNNKNRGEVNPELGKQSCHVPGLPVQLVLPGGKKYEYLKPEPILPVGKAENS